MAAPKMNKYAQEWTLENCMPRFEDALIYSEENDDCLCLQDAIHQTLIPSTTFYELVKKHEVLKRIKKDIEANVIRRVNALAIRDKAPAAPAIFRMKQLGERDEQHVVSESKTNTTVTVVDKHTMENINKLKIKFENE